MTEDSMGSGRPRKNTRKSNGNNNYQELSNGTLNIPEAHVIVEPLSSAMSDNINANEDSSDAIIYSPAKIEENSEICALCNCGQEMHLILGEITQYTVASGTLRKLEKIKSENTEKSAEISSSDSQKDTKEKTFFKRRRRKKNNDFDSNLSPDMTTFGTAKMQEFSDILDSKRSLFAHHCCAAWSAGVSQNDSCDLENVDKAVAKALTKKCSHCQRYGASVECQVHRCNKIFHYPCCASAGAFQDIKSMNLLCPDHLDRTEKLDDADPSCDACGKADNLNLQLFCTSCGHHFHSYCVEMTIPITSVVRMGWQCSYCKVCQGCKQTGNDDRMLVCDHCDKGFHTYCLNPPITSIPKSIWKCTSCRKCDDCGSTRPGGGPSCRWHNNFSLCDRCYQQRKKGQCCPVCNRAVRLCNNVEIIQCCRCHKCVHKECDPDSLEENYICILCIKQENQEFSDGNDVDMVEADNSLSQVEDNEDSYDYNLLETGQKKLTLEEAELFSMAASKDFIDSCTLNNNNFDLNEIQNNFENQGSINFEMKPDGIDEKYSESTIDSPYSSVMSESYADQAHTTFFPSTRRSSNRGRGFKLERSKRRNRNGSVDSAAFSMGKSEKAIQIPPSNEPDSTSSLVASTKGVPESVNTDEGEDDEFGETENDGEDGLHSTVLVVSTRDSFTLKQDICMCCGSFGKGREGYLISCVQCGQCFHPYCVSVKVNEVILSRGWRCIDCTVCEGCGRNADEANLLLCDICDVSFHIYCLEPPLEEVPVGGWKCQWCAVCEDCGIKEPGFGCSWMGNYSQCGQCSSERYCSICSYSYEPNSLVIQCEKCDRWAHGDCDGLGSESDAKLACTMTYHCVHCRPKTKHLGIYSSLKSSVITKVSIRKALSNSQGEKPKKAKTLKDVKLDKLSKAALREQKRAEEDAQPLVPHSAIADESGVVCVDLNLLKSKLRCDDTLKERLHLTEVGLKQIKGLVIRAPHIRNIKARRKKEERSLLVQSIFDIHDDQSMDKSETPFETSADHDILSPEVKQEEGLELDIAPETVPDTTAENDDLLLDDDAPDPEDATDPFEFFGVNLLEKHLHMELEHISSGKKKRPKKEKKEKRKKKDAKIASFFTGPSVPDPTDLSLSIAPAHPPPSPLQKIVDPAMAIEVPEQEETTSQQLMEVELTDLKEEPLNSTVDSESFEQTDMGSAIDLTLQDSKVSLATTTITSVDAMQTDEALEPLQMDNPEQSPLSVDVVKQQHPLEIKVDSSSPNITSKMVTPPIDLISTAQDLPHVDGHEMAQYLAGIESESSLPSNSAGGGHPLDMFPHSLLQPSFDPLNELSKQQQHQHHHNMMMQIKSPPIMSPTGPGIDPFKYAANFVDDKDFGEGPTPVKIDAQTQKQLKKWEADEKLGELATISPVLYSNIIHKEEMNTKYKDWPARGRAIARLWRKLPTEEREPYRVKAKENRVKQKENKKKKTTKKEPATQMLAIPMPVVVSQPSTQEQSSLLSSSSSNTQPPQVKMENEIGPPPQNYLSQSAIETSGSTTSVTSFSPVINMPPSSDFNSRILISPSPSTLKTAVPPPSVQQKLNQQPPLRIDNPIKTSIGATLLTVPEPQQLSPLLQNISPPFTISSLSNVMRSPTSPFLPNAHSPYLPNTPSTPRTPVTPVSDTASTKSDPSDSAGKDKKAKRPKLSKQKREQNKLMREQKKKLVVEKEQQWKILQQQRIFEQQRQAILNQSKALAMDPMHPSQRFNATMNSSLAEDALQHSLMMKAKAEAAQIHSSTISPTTTVNTLQTMTSASISSRTHSTSLVTTTATPSTSSSSGKLSDQASSKEVPNIPSSEHFSHHQEMMQHQQLQGPPKGMHGAGNSADQFNSFMNEHIDPMRMRSSEQHKAFLFQQQQQQQYMASQQQYIQWQLAQQAAGNMYNQKSAKSGLEEKGEGGMSESEEQERMRLFNQRQQLPKNLPPPPQHGQHGRGEKRPGEHPGNSHFMFPDGRPPPPPANHGFPQPQSRGGGGSSGQFPGANSPEAALYQQMFMEYFMRYRKSQGIDTSQFPSHELYLMAEFAKQSFARQMQQYGKGFPPMSQSNHPSGQDLFGKPPPQPPHNFGGPPQQDQYDWGRGPPVSSMSHLEMLAHQHSTQAGVHKSPAVSTNTIQQHKVMNDNKQQHKPSHSKPPSNMHGGGLPKSASFQISRIAADSTSNDDFPSNNNSMTQEEGGSKKARNPPVSENEITSSKGSRGPSESADSVGDAVENNKVLSGVSGGTGLELEDERSVGQPEHEPEQRRHHLCRQNDDDLDLWFGDASISRGVRRNNNRRAVPSRTRQRYAEDEEEELLRRCSVPDDTDNDCYYGDSSDEGEGAGDEDRCFLDNQPICTMGVSSPEKDTYRDSGCDERKQSVGGSSSIMDDNSNSTPLPPSRPESRSSEMERSNSSSLTDMVMKSSREQQQPTSNHFSSPPPPPSSSFSNVPDSAYINSLLGGGGSGEGRSSRSPIGRPTSFPSHPGLSSHNPTSVSANFANYSQDPTKPGGVGGFPMNMNNRTYSSPFPASSGGKGPMSHVGNSVGMLLANEFLPKSSGAAPTSSNEPWKGMFSMPNSGGFPQPNGMQQPERKMMFSDKKKTPEKANQDSNVVAGGQSTLAERRGVPLPFTDSTSRNATTPVPSSITCGVQAPAAVAAPSHAVVSSSMGQDSSTTMNKGMMSSASVPPSSGASKVVSIHPGSPQYHQIFIYQHQLLIMQFQQYQFQLQAQFQQLRIQQMSPQQMAMLSQQFHQQMMLLQQQFNQQQAQLHRMAATGMQFTENQLNAMYQQQIMTQQTYQQWIMALSPAQRVHLQQRMQALMRDVQHQMAQIMQQQQSTRADVPVSNVEEPQQQNAKAKKAKPRRKKKQSAPDPADMPPPKLPVPEISPSMQKLQQIGQEPTPTPSGSFDPPHSSLSSIPTSMQASSSNNVTAVTTTSSIETPIMASFTPPPPPPQTHPQVGLSKKSPVSISPSSQGFHTNNTMNSSRTSVISPTNAAVRPPLTPPPPPLPSTSMMTKTQSSTNSIPSQIEEIQRSFILQQQNVRKDSKKDSTTPKSAGSTSGIQDPKRQQMFFPDRVPVHPSQLLRKKWKSGQSPTTPSPTSTKPQQQQLEAGKPQGSIDDLKHPFTSQPELHQMALDAMQNKSTIQKQQQQQQQSQPQSTHASAMTPPQHHLHHENDPKSQKSAFSVSTLLGTNSNKAQQPKGVVFPSVAHDNTDSSTTDRQPPPNAAADTGSGSTNNDIAGFISPADHQKEMERKKMILKLKKKEEKEKVMLERKIARDLEKQKRLEERSKLKEMRDQKKAEKIQERRLVKQRQMQAKALATEAKRKLHKQSQLARQQKLNSNNNAPPVKPVERVVVSPPNPSPKSPPTPPKIPLCEPLAQVSTPLVQPLGIRDDSSDPVAALTGKFGAALFDGFDDIYGEKPAADVILQDSDLNSAAVTLFNDVPLFASPERIELCEDDVLGGCGAADATTINPASGVVTDENNAIAVVNPDLEMPEDFRRVLNCNNCYGPLHKTVLFIDRGFEEISEGVFDKNDVLESDQLTFCSNDCVELYQMKIDYTIDDDVALVDAVKVASMVCLDEEHFFPPLPSDRVRGDQFAPGIDGSAQLKPAFKKRWTRWHYPFNTTKKPVNKTRLDREGLYRLMNKYDIRLKLSDDGIKDRRVCILCKLVGDGETAQASRLLNYDVDQWVHLNCALWSNEVYEALNGGLHNVDKARERAATTKCAHCHKVGASIACSHTFGAQQRLHCEKIFHFCCALQAQCAFYKDKTILCSTHKSFGVSNEELRNFTVRRKVYIERDITRQIAKMLQLNNELDRKEYTFRVGNLIFHELGQIPLKSLEKFADTDHVFPIGFETMSLFWDYQNSRKRRYYTCSISDRHQTPHFKVKVHSNGSDGAVFTSPSAKGSWEEEILVSIQKKREDEKLLKFFPEFISGQTLFGLMDSTIKRMIESLPGIGTLEKYNFRFGRTPMLIKELPLALNPTGCIRSERFFKHHIIRPLAMRTASTDHSLTPGDTSANNDSWLSYPQRTAQILGTKTGQYRRMRQDWRNTVLLGRSRIQGLGLFLKKDVEENTFIIEYIGRLIRNEVANRLEGHYERQNRGIYMFRIDSDAVVDATMAGGPARYINHSCDPNCVAEIISIEGRKRIIIISSRRIEKGEELTYDYKFDLEDDSSKIECLCGATNCRKWMN